MNFIAYTFKSPAVGVFFAVVNLIVVFLLTVFFLYDCYILFLVVDIVFVALYGTFFTINYHNWFLYKEREVKQRLRDIHSTNFRI
jgi:hypothetical protein